GVGNAELPSDLPDARTLHSALRTPHSALACRRHHTRAPRGRLPGRRKNASRSVQPSRPRSPHPARASLRAAPPRCRRAVARHGLAGGVRPPALGARQPPGGRVVRRSRGGLRQTHDTAAGFQWLRRLDAQTKEYVLNGPLLDQKIVRQEGLVTIWDLPDILLSRRDGLPLGYVFPRSGTPVIEDAIGVVRNA